MDDDAYDARAERDRADHAAVVEYRAHLAKARRSSLEPLVKPEVSFLDRLRAHAEAKQSLQVHRDSRRNIGGGGGEDVAIVEPVSAADLATPTLPSAQSRVSRVVAWRVRGPFCGHPGPVVHTRTRWRTRT